MRSSTMVRLIDAALLAAPVCAFACGGVLDLGPDASTQDVTTRDVRGAPPSNDDPAGPGHDGGLDSAGIPDSGFLDAGCVRETIFDGGCGGQDRGIQIHTTCGDPCPTLCQDYFNACNCGYGYKLCDWTDASVMHCYCGISGGRWTAGVEQRPLRDATLGGFFAWMVWGESASIHAFAVLERELLGHGAPRRLVAAARRARRDEERHTRMGQRLALRHGVTAEVAPAPAPAGVRLLEEIAIENAVEACVSETWSAVLTRAQVTRARDPMIRRAFARIADDEARHATLAWSVAEWAGRKLSRMARARVDASMKRAVDDLRGALAEPCDAQREAGIPSRAEQAVMLSALEESLWSGLK